MGRKNQIKQKKNETLALANLHVDLLVFMRIAGTS